MDAKAIKRFHAVRENRTYNAGDVFTGSEIRVRQLVERGYVEVPDTEPKPRKTRKPKTED